MRRDKRQRLPGLPEKREHEMTAPLSDEQRRMHLEVMKSAGSGNAHPFELLHELMDIYQHPALRPRYEGIPANEAIERCPKLAAVIDCLSDIRRRGEKTLIFANRKPMQQLLKAVIDQRFGLRVDIINGDRAGADKNGARATRRQMLDRFRSQPGFDVLVLSPIVAGLGLTLVEANHVIHYGRWWNPALEAQATDRIYRIGQTRPVHVYYPIAVDPLKEFTTFDEKLARIIKRRRQMAEDFLAPLPGEQEIQKELLDDVLT
jgi:SNF2 family DNA or RNA helicase